MKRIIIISAVVLICLLAVTVVSVAAIQGGFSGVVKTDRENAAAKKPGELMKKIMETDDYRTAYDDLTPYSYDTFMFHSVKKPSSYPDVLDSRSVKNWEIRPFHSEFPIERLIVVDEDHIVAEYKLEKNGSFLPTFVFFKKYIGTNKNGEAFESWQFRGEIYFAYPELRSGDILSLKGTEIKISELPIFIDLRQTWYLSSDEEGYHAEETVLLQDGYAIVEYMSDLPYEGDAVTVTDVTFIPYGQTDDRYPNNSLISLTFVPAFSR